MKKIVFALICAIGLVSCDKSQPATNTSGVSTAYVDTSKLLKEYEEAKDLDAKYKAKEEQISKELNADFEKLKADIAYFEKNAQAKGAQWAQQNGAVLQEREQRLAYAERGMQQKLSAEYGKEADTLVKKIKTFIKEYGKEKNFDYILGTNESSNTVLYAKDGQEITDDILKLLNEKYKANKSKDDTLELTEDKDTATSK